MAIAPSKETMMATIPERKLPRWLSIILVIPLAGLRGSERDLGKISKKILRL
jgi:hypothetical protein